MDHRDDEMGIDICLVHPNELSEADWLEINKLAKKFAEQGEDNVLKCSVMGYVEWLSLDNINMVKQ